MKVKKVDGFQKIEDGQEVMHFTSIEQANNWLDAYEKGSTKESYHKENFKRFDNAGATVAPRKDQIKFLEYAMSLLNPRKYEREITLLRLRVRGYPIKLIAQELKVSVDEVKKVEETALRRVKDAIKHTTENCIPILGGA